MYTLHGGFPTRGLMVEMVLAEAGADYRLVDVDIRAGAHRTADYLAVNPLGWVPALVTPEGERLAETPAINLWLCERHGLDLVPGPGDPLRGAFLSAFFNVTGEVEPAMKRIFYPARYAPAPATPEAAREQGWEALEARLAPLDTRLATAGPWLTGGRFTLADLTLAYWMPYVRRDGRLAQFPAIERAFEATRSRPALAPLFRQLLGGDA